MNSQERCGFVSGLVGRNDYENPFTTDDDRHYEWMSGWHKGQEDERAINPIDWNKLKIEVCLKSLHR